MIARDVRVLGASRYMQFWTTNQGMSLVLATVITDFNHQFPDIQFILFNLYLNYTFFSLYTLNVTYVLVCVASFCVFRKYMFIGTLVSRTEFLF